MTSLFMVQIELDAARVHSWAAQCRLPPQDTGYICHSLMCAAYGDLRPKPFVVQERRGSFKVLGYTRHPAAELEAMRRETAEPAVDVCFRSEQSKLMPENWTVGRRYAFELRACPTRQGLDPKKVAEGRKNTKREADAILFAQGGRSRDDVYQEWLSERMSEAVRLDRVELTGFSLLRASRRGEGSDHPGVRRVRSLTLPDASFRGELTIVNSEEFSRILGAGVGRHDAFGFGAILLRPMGG